MAAPYRAKNLRISGVQEIKKNLEALVRVGLDGNVLYKAMGDAVEPIIRHAKANIAPLSSSVLMSIYKADSPPPSRPRKKTVLVVVHKSDTMREWNAAPGNTSPRAKVVPWVVSKGKLTQRGNRTGQKNNNAVAESLATMFELGTTRRWRHAPGMQAHYWFRNAVEQAKAEVAANLKQAFNEIIEETIRRMNIPSTLP